MAIVKSGDKEKHQEHPSQSNASRYPEDILLRKHGYSIHSRKKNQEAIWIKDRVLVSHTDALAEVKSNR